MKRITELKFNLFDYEEGASVQRSGDSFRRRGRTT